MQFGNRTLVLRGSISSLIGRKVTVQGFLGLTCVRTTASQNAKAETVSKNLSYRPAFDSPISEQHRPIVLLYSWLVAKSKHIFKYSDYYLGKGIDVLQIKVEPAQIVLPTKAQSVVGQVLDFVNERKPFQTQPVLAHGFSVGGYLFGETLVKILQTEVEKYGEIGERLAGQIFDSPVDMEGVPKGFSRAVTNVRPLQVTIQSTMELYLKLFENITVKHYKRSSETFHENFLKVPTLLLYSYCDPIGVADRIEFVMEKWKAKGIEVYSQAWDDSPHVSHFLYHSVEYITALNMFLENIGMIHQAENALDINIKRKAQA